MASCLMQDANGNLYLSTDSIATCSGFVVLEPQEYSEMQFLTSAFEVPTVPQLQELFVWAFGIVVIPFLVAFMYQSVIGWFESETLTIENYGD